MFQGTYELMKVVARSEGRVTISRFTQKEAADPSTCIAALISLSSGFDTLIAIDDEVFSVNSTGLNGNYWLRKPVGNEPLAFDVKPLGKEMSEMIMKWLKLKEKARKGKA